MLEIGLRRLVWHLHAIAVDIELPAVIDAAQSAFLVAAEIHRRPAVRTFLVEDADPALGVAECHHILAEQTKADRVAIRSRQFLGDEGGHPEAPEQFAHRRARAYPAQQFVLFGSQHGGLRFSTPELPKKE